MRGPRGEGGRDGWPCQRVELAFAGCLEAARRGVEVAGVEVKMARRKEQRVRDATLLAAEGARDWL